VIISLIYLFVQLKCFFFLGDVILVYASLNIFNQDNHCCGVGRQVLSIPLGEASLALSLSA
jgi:hypothetical protein